MMAVLGYSIQHLTVADEGDRLAISFGPWPLLEKASGTTGSVGWKSAARRSWTAGASTGVCGAAGSGTRPECVVIRRRRGVIRVGTDDAQGLAEFLKSRSRS